MGTPQSRDRRREGQDDLRAGQRRDAEDLVDARHERRGVEVLLRRARNGPARVLPPPARPPRRADDFRLGHQGRLLRDGGGRRCVLQRTDVPAAAPVRLVQLPGLVQLRPVPAVRHRQERRRGLVLLEPPEAGDRTRGDAVRASAVLGVLHPGVRRHDGRHHGPGAQRGDALQVRQRHRVRPLDAPQLPRETQRRRPAERPALVPQGVRRDRQRREVGRQDAPRGQDEYAEVLAPGHQGVRRGQVQGGEEGLGADRAGLRRRFQRRCVRFRLLPERESERPPERRLHEGGC